VWNMAQRYKTRHLIPQIVDEVRAKKKVPVAYLAYKYNLSRHYLRYMILKNIIEMYSDIKIVREDSKEYVVSEA